MMATRNDLYRELVHNSASQTQTFEMKFCIVGIQLTSGAWADTGQVHTDRLVSIDGRHGGLTLVRTLARRA